MELRQLRAFLEVVSEGHFGRAATRLNLTQPALTQRIQSLERELGVQVLHRSAREVRLTPAGEALLPYATSLVRIEERANHELNDLAAGIRGRLRIAHLASGAVAMPGKIVAEFRQRYPTVDVETSSAPTRINLERLTRGELDAAFIAVGGELPDRVIVRVISHVPHLVAMPLNHPLAAFDPVPVTALAGEPVITAPSGLNPGVVASFEKWLTRRTGARLNIVATEPPEQALEMVAESGTALAFVSGGRAAMASVRGVACRSLSPSPMIDLGVAYLEDDPTPTLANLLELIDDVAGLGPGDVPPGSELLTVESAEPPATAAVSPGVQPSAQT